MYTGMSSTYESNWEYNTCNMCIQVMGSTYESNWEQYM